MKKKGPDSLEGVLIAVVACLISTLMFGTIELSSMLFVACITRYGTNRNKASFPFMLSNVLQAMTGPVAGYLAQRFSVRIVVFAGSILSFVGVAGCFFAEDIVVVTVLWGIVFGTGLGFATLLLPVVINDYFVEQRSKALGVCYVGSPIGFFVFPSLLEMLTERYGLSGSFLLLAAVNAHCIPLSLLLTRPNFAAKDGGKESGPEKPGGADGEVSGPPERSRSVQDGDGSPCRLVLDKSDPPGTPVLLKYTKTDGGGGAEKAGGRAVEKRRKSALDLYSDPAFVLICLVNGLANLNFGTLATVIVDFGRDHDTRPDHDKYVLMCISATGVVGMLGFGWVTDGGHVTRTRWASFTLIVGCFCILAMPQTSGFATLLVPLSVFCVCQSSFVPLVPAIAAEHISEELQEVAISACNVLTGPMFFVIPPLIGHFRDGKGSYNNIFYLMAGLSVVNSLSVFAIPYVARWRDKTEK